LSVSLLSAENVVLFATDEKTVCGAPEDSADTSFTRVPACDKVEPQVIIKTL